MTVHGNASAAPYIALMDIQTAFDSVASVIRSIPRSELLIAAIAAMLAGWIGAGLGAFAVGYATDIGITMSVAISSTAIVFVGVAFVLLMAARFTAPKDIAARQR